MTQRAGATTTRDVARERRSALLGRRTGRPVVACLFLVLVSLQLLDLHSTLTASAAQLETNRLLLWLRSGMSFAWSVAAIKAIDLLAVVSMYSMWRRTKGRFDLEVGLSVALVAFVYALVVANNYASR